MPEKEIFDLNAQTLSYLQNFIAKKKRLRQLPDDDARYHFTIDYTKILLSYDSWKRPC